MDERSTNGNSDTAPSEPDPAPNRTEIDAGALQRAKRMDFGGDAEDRGRVGPEADPAGFGMEDHRESHRLSEENTRQCRNFCQAVSKAVDATAVVFGVDLEITDEEHQLLGEAWGDVLRHHVTIKDGSYRGDWMAAVGESTAVIVSRKDKIKRIAEQRRAQASEEGDAE